MQNHRQRLGPSSRLSTISCRLVLWFATGWWGLAAIGCGELVGVEGPALSTGAGTETQGKAGDAQGAAGSEETVASEETEQAVSISLATWEEIMRAAKAEGRPAVVDVWSLSCEPCLKEFPGLVRLEEQWGDRLHCVSANIDFDGRKTRPPETYKHKALDFLQQNKAALANYLCTTPSDDVYADLKIASIPAVLVFDAEGKEVARFVDAGETLGFTYEEDVMPFVREMLEPAATSGGE